MNLIQKSVFIDHTHLIKQITRKLILYIVATMMKRMSYCPMTMTMTLKNMSYSLMTWLLIMTLRRMSYCLMTWLLTMTMTMTLVKIFWNGGMPEMVGSHVVQKKWRHLPGYLPAWRRGGANCCGKWCHL